MALATTTDPRSVEYSYTKQELSEQQICFEQNDFFCTILQSQFNYLGPFFLGII
jgi:hypothetical protein